MHPRFNEQLASQHMQQLQRESAMMRRVASEDIAILPASRAYTSVLWYLIFGMRISTYKAEQDSSRYEYVPDKLQDLLGTMVRTISAISLALGVLIGSFLFSRFGLFSAALLSGALLVVISVPILMRAAGMLKANLVK
jgi:hypothetical protein